MGSSSEDYDVSMLEPSTRRRGKHIKTLPSSNRQQRAMMRENKQEEMIDVDQQLTEYGMDPGLLPLTEKLEILHALMKSKESEKQQQQLNEMLHSQQAAMSASMLTTGKVGKQRGQRKGKLADLPQTEHPEGASSLKQDILPAAGSGSLSDKIDSVIQKTVVEDSDETLDPTIDESLKLEMSCSNEESSKEADTMSEEEEFCLARKKVSERHVKQQEKVKRKGRKAKYAEPVTERSQSECLSLSVGVIDLQKGQESPLSDQAPSASSQRLQKGFVSDRPGHADSGDGDSEASEVLCVQDEGVQASLGTPVSSPQPDDTDAFSYSTVPHASKMNKPSHSRTCGSGNDESGQSMLAGKSSSGHSSGSETDDENIVAGSQQSCVKTPMIRKSLHSIQSTESATRMKSLGSPDIFSQQEDDDETQPLSPVLPRLAMGNRQDSVAVHSTVQHREDSASSAGAESQTFVPSLEDIETDQNLRTGEKRKRQTANVDVEDTKAKKLCLPFDLFDPFPTATHKRSPMSPCVPLIAKRKRLEMIVDPKPYFTPAGHRSDEYACCILEYIQSYQRVLKKKQACAPVFIKWGKPVTPGPHMPGTLDKAVTCKTVVVLTQAKTVAIDRPLLSKRKAARQADIRLQETTNQLRHAAKSNPVTRDLEEQESYLIHDSSGNENDFELPKIKAKRKPLRKTHKKPQASKLGEDSVVGIGEDQDAETLEYSFQECVANIQEQYGLPEKSSGSQSPDKSEIASQEEQLSKLLITQTNLPERYKIPRVQSKKYVESDEDFNRILDNLPKTKRKRELCRTSNLGKPQKKCKKTQDEADGGPTKQPQARKKHKCKQDIFEDMENEENDVPSSPIFVPQKVKTQVKQMLIKSRDSVPLEIMTSDMSDDQGFSIPLLERTTAQLCKSKSKASREAKRIDSHEASPVTSPDVTSHGSLHHLLEQGKARADSDIGRDMSSVVQPLDVCRQSPTSSEEGGRGMQQLSVVGKKNGNRGAPNVMGGVEHDVKRRTRTGRKVMRPGDGDSLDKSIQLSSDDDEAVDGKQEASPPLATKRSKEKGSVSATSSTDGEQHEDRPVKKEALTGRRKSPQVSEQGEMTAGAHGIQNLKNSSQASGKAAGSRVRQHADHQHQEEADKNNQIDGSPRRCRQRGLVATDTDNDQGSDSQQRYRRRGRVTADTVENQLGNAPHKHHGSVADDMDEHQGSDENQQSALGGSVADTDDHQTDNVPHRQRGPASDSTDDDQAVEAAHQHRLRRPVAAYTDEDQTNNEAMRKRRQRGPVADSMDDDYTNNEAPHKHRQRGLVAVGTDEDHQAQHQHSPIGDERVNQAGNAAREGKQHAPVAAVAAQQQPAEPEGSQHPTVECPLCFKKFPEEAIMEHAAGCQGDQEDEADVDVGNAAGNRQAPPDVRLHEQHGRAEAQGAVVDAGYGGAVMRPQSQEQLGVCPVCNAQVEHTILEQHVNDCLENAAQEAEPQMPAIRQTRRRGANANTGAEEMETMPVRQRGRRE